jgi:hypothetical protein
MAAGNTAQLHSSTFIHLRKFIMRQEQREREPEMKNKDKKLDRFNIYIQRLVD